MEKTPYDRRMEVLDQIRYGDANKNLELAAAAAAYERLKTAIAITETLLGNASPDVAAMVAAEIGAEARHAQLLRSAE